MFKKLLKREKHRVYLGALVVFPRTDIKRHFELLGYFQTEDLYMELTQTLKEIFFLPPSQNIKEPSDTDLGLDVIVSEFQSGVAVVISLGDIGFPLFWRPKVTVSSRLYYLKSEKTKAIFSVTEKMQWCQYIKRLFSWHSLFRFKSLFDKNDMNHILYEACHKLLLKMQRKYDL